jgi:hypothetical protein
MKFLRLTKVLPLTCALAFCAFGQSKPPDKPSPKPPPPAIPAPPPKDNPKPKPKPGGNAVETIFITGSVTLADR